MPVKTVSVSRQRLNNQQFAVLFTQLARLEAAGLSVQQQITLIFNTDKALQAFYAPLQKAVAAGASFAATGFKLGLFTANQYAIIAAAENSGQTMRIYQYLAEYYSRKASQLKKIKSRLVLPLLVLVISILLAPITDLFKHSITLTDYFKQTLGSLLLLYLSLYATVNFAKITAILHIESDWHRLQLRIPPIKKWLSQRQTNDFLTYLGLMLAAGMPFTEALPLAANTLANTVLKSQFKMVLAPRYLQAGNSVYIALSSLKMLDREALQIINSSEQSGKLADGLLHYTQQTSESLAMQDEELATWLPRIVYSLIAIGMIVSIFSAYADRLAMLPT